MVRTRAQRRKRQRAEEPVPEEEDQTLKLPDSTLHHVFEFLALKELEGVAQVCRRWRSLCEERCAWRGRRALVRCPDGDWGDFLRLVRALRRSHGVAPCCAVRLTADPDQDEESYLGEEHQFKVAFLAAKGGGGGLELQLTVSTALMLLLCIRELVRIPVHELQIKIIPGYFLSDCEALSVWEAIASKWHISKLTLLLNRRSCLLRSSFRWPKEHDSLTFLHVQLFGAEFHILGHKPHRQSETLLSLLRANEDVERLILVAQEYQHHLLECNQELLELGAEIGPSLVKVLKRQSKLYILHLAIEARDYPKGAAPGMSSLSTALSLPNISTRLYHLFLLWDDNSKFPEAEQLAVLAALAQCRNLRYLELERLAVLSEERGAAPLRALLWGLPKLRGLRLREAPCVLPLAALVPSESDEPAGDAPLELELRRQCPIEQREPRRDWPSALRGLIKSRPTLHVRLAGFHWRCLPTPAHSPGLFDDKEVMLLPHRKDDYCRDCPAVAARKEKIRVHFFEDYRL